MTTIKSIALYPRDYESCIDKTPKGCAVASRVYEHSGHPIDNEPWPALAIGEEVEILTQNHWVWRATVEEVRDANTALVRIVGTKTAMPLPPIIEGQRYVLPYMSGDAWSVRPEAGKILTIGGVFYRVTGKPKPFCGGGFAYQFTTVTAEAHAKRPGRVAIKNKTDTDRGSIFWYGHSVGRCIQIKDEWLHVEKIERQAYGDGEGREVFGYNTYGIGHFVPAVKAAKLNARWEAQEKVRSIELSLRVARQDIDYGGRPEAVPGLVAALEAAQKIAEAS